MKDYTDLIDKIRTGVFGEQELINLLANAQERQAMDVIEAIRIQLRESYPRAANRLFGAKQNYAAERLQAVLSRVLAQFDLTKNCVGSGVKAGGDMLAGRKHIDLYISYKNDKGDGAFLSLTQVEPASELLVYVTRYKTGKDGFAEEREKTLSDLDEAVSLYEERLREVGATER